MRSPKFTGTIQSDSNGYGLVAETDLVKGTLLVCAHSYFSTSLPPTDVSEIYIFVCKS